MSALPSRSEMSLPDVRGRNPLKHAAYSRSALLPGEDAAERQELEDAYYEHFQPATQPEVDAVRELVDLNWRRARLARAEAAMVTQAVADADRKIPEPILDLAREISSMQIEVGILEKLLTKLRDEIEHKGGRPKELVQGMAPVLDRLLNWQTTTADMKPDQLLAEGARALEARIRSMEASRATLKMLVDASKVVREAAQAEASLLDPKQAARLLQERTTLSRAIERQIRVLRELRGGAEFEAHVRMTAAGARLFHETNLDRGGVLPAREAAA